MPSAELTGLLFLCPLSGQVLVSWRTSSSAPSTARLTCSDFICEKFLTPDRNSQVRGIRWKWINIQTWPQIADSVSYMLHKLEVLHKEGNKTLSSKLRHARWFKAYLIPICCGIWDLARWGICNVTLSYGIWGLWFKSMSSKFSHRLFLLKNCVSENFHPLEVFFSFEHLWIYSTMPSFPPEPVCKVVLCLVLIRS